MRKIRDYFLLVLKGMGMGASDVVPGVSGGTIAFITGIYEELIHSLKSIGVDTIGLLLKFRLKEFWKRINGNFLVAVFSGVLISIFSLARILEFLLINHPSLIWSFFFGLVLSSAIMILLDINQWKWHTILAVVIGTVTAYIVTSFTPAKSTEATWFVFLSGSLAICAMILPGISGSFILLLLGKYKYILAAVNDLKFDILGTFIAGAIIGLILFSNLLSWLLSKFRYFTISLLAGFMLGSLNKIWPWKQTIETYVDSHGVEHPLIQRNILPDLSTESEFVPSLLLALLVAGIIFFLVRMSKNKKEGIS